MQFLEIFSLITGVIYVWFQIKQSNWMWPLNIICCVAAAIVYINSSLWANACINIGYCLMGIWGIVAWIRDARKVESGELHLRHLSKRVSIWSALVCVVGGFLIIQVLRQFGDSDPFLDGIISILGIVGTWWLAQSYLENWSIWIVADLLGVVLCLSQGLWWMALLYAVYTLASVWGLNNWKKHGTYID